MCHQAHSSHRSTQYRMASSRGPACRANGDGGGRAMGPCGCACAAEADAAAAAVAAAAAASALVLGVSMPGVHIGVSLRNTQPDASVPARMPITASPRSAACHAPAPVQGAVDRAVVGAQPMPAACIVGTAVRPAPRVVPAICCWRAAGTLDVCGRCHAAAAAAGLSRSPHAQQARRQTSRP